MMVRIVRKSTLMPLWLVLLLLMLVSQQSSNQVNASANGTTANATNETTVMVTTDVAPPPQALSTTADPNNVGEGVFYEPNTTLFPAQDTCAHLLSHLADPTTRKPGAQLHGPLCVPTAVRQWVLQNSTRSTNNKPTDVDIMDCIATCSEKYSPKSATVSIIYMFQKCYCYEDDFHQATDHNKYCCEDDLIYEDYYQNTKNECMAKMYGNVYTTTLLCPINNSMCRSQPASYNCETRSVHVDSIYYDKNGVKKDGGYSMPNALCCIPKNSMLDDNDWGLQVAQYTIVFISVLALFQIMYWILRKRQADEDSGGGGSSSGDQPRLLVVPMVDSSSSSSSSLSGAAGRGPVTVTQAGRTNQQAIAAAKEIMALFPVISAEQLSGLSDDEDSCSVCLDPLASTKAVKLAVCGHMFHYNCLLTYMAHKLGDRVRQVTCPMCRSVVVDASVNDDAAASSSLSPSGGGSPAGGAAAAAVASSATSSSRARAAGASSSSSSPGAIPTVSNRGASSTQSSPGMPAPLVPRSRGASITRAGSGNPLTRSLLDGPDVEMLAIAQPNGGGRATAAARSVATTTTNSNSNNGFITSSLL